MEQLRCLLPAFVVITIISLAYGSHRRRVQQPVVSLSVITWINFIIMVLALLFGAGVAPKDAFGFTLLVAIVLGLYLFYLKPRLPWRD